MINIGVEQEMLNKLCEYEPLNEFLIELKDPQSKGLLEHKIRDIRQEHSVSDMWIYLMVEGTIHFRREEHPHKVQQVLLHLAEKYTKHGLKEISPKFDKPEFDRLSISQHNQYMSNWGLKHNITVDYRWVVQIG